MMGSEVIRDPIQVPVHVIFGDMGMSHLGCFRLCQLQTNREKTKQ